MKSTEVSMAAPTIRVVLVDAHPVLRAGVASLLARDAELDLVGQAGDARAALSLVAQARPDVAVLDMFLPDRRAHDLTRELLDGVPRLRIVGFAAEVEAAGVRELLAAGAVGCVLKSSPCDDLARAIKVAAHGGIYLDSGIALPLIGGSVSSRQPSSDGLSDREMQVMRLVANGHTAKQSAEELGLSPRTLETYKARAMSKLKLHTRAELQRYALRCGWLSAPVN